jgi:hypothetical protein
MIDMSLPILASAVYVSRIDPHRRPREKSLCASPRFASESPSAALLVEPRVVTWLESFADSDGKI